MAHSIPIKNSGQIRSMNEQDIQEPLQLPLQTWDCWQRNGAVSSSQQQRQSQKNLKERLLKATDKAQQGSSLRQKQKLRINKAVSEWFKIIKAPLIRSSRNALCHHREERIYLLFIHTGDK